MATAVEICIVCSSLKMVKQGVGICEPDFEKRDFLIHIENANQGRPSCPLHKHDRIDPAAPAPKPEPIKPLSRSQWHFTAEDLSRFAIATDPGLGTTVYRILSAHENPVVNAVLHPFAISAVCAFLKHEYGSFNLKDDATNWFKTGEQCGNCLARQRDLDIKYSLK
jgi:hypothetical protein